MWGQPPSAVPRSEASAGGPEPLYSLFPLGPLLDPPIDVGPSRRNAAAMLFLNHSEGSVMKPDHRLAVLFAQPVLHIRHDGVRHEQRPGDLQQRRTLDRLHVPPQVAVAIAQIAKPSPARPRFDLHWHLAVLILILGTNLLEQRFECCLQGRVDVDLLRDRQGQTFNARNRWTDTHASSLKVVLLPKAAIAVCLIAGSVASPTAGSTATAESTETTTRSTVEERPFRTALS